MGPKHNWSFGPLELCLESIGSQGDRVPVEGERSPATLEHLCVERREGVLCKQAGNALHVLRVSCRDTYGSPATAALEQSDQRLGRFLNVDRPNAVGINTRGAEGKEVICLK